MSWRKQVMVLLTVCISVSACATPKRDAQETTVWKKTRKVPELVPSLEVGSQRTLIPPLAYEWSTNAKTLKLVPTSKSLVKTTTVTSSADGLELLLHGPAPDFSELRVFDQFPGEGIVPSTTLFTADIHWTESETGTFAKLDSAIGSGKFIILWCSWYIPISAQLSIAEEYASWLFVV
jgi:hypothetical protein